MSSFQIGGFVQGAEVFKGGDAGLAAGAVGGDFARRDPVDEAPPGELDEQAIWLLMPAEPIEDGASPRNHGADEPLAVGAVKPVIVDHSDPEQRESRYRLH